MHLALCMGWFVVRGCLFVLFFALDGREEQPDPSEPNMGRYTDLVRKLLAMPTSSAGIPFGSFLPADIAFVVETLADKRIKELRLILNDRDISHKVKSHIYGRQFHTYQDFCLELKHKRPGRRDFIDFGSSLERGNPDLVGYLAHIRTHDPAFADFLQTPQQASIDREAFETSVYVTGETKSGKSYLIETIAHQMAKGPNAGVWILDPHGSLARNCADWKDNVDRRVFYFDANISTPERIARFNPFDQLPDTTPATLDIVTQEQVNAFSVIAGASAMSDNMRNLLASSIHLMLTLPNGSMQELFRLMDNERNEDLVEAGTRLDNRFHREFFEYEFPKKTYAATKAAIATRLAALLSSSILYAVTNGKSSFHIPTAFNQPGLYIFNFGKGVIGETASTMFGRLVLAHLQASAFKREREGLSERKVPTRNYVLVDECHNFVNRTTGTIVAEARKYGLSLILAQQFAGQDIEPSLFKNIMTNTPLKFTGVGTASTYEHVAQSQQVERESFYGLKPRRFHVSKRGSAPFIAAASPLLASQDARMTPDEWQGFLSAQRARWYGVGAATGVRVVSGSDPDAYAHERASEKRTEPIAPEPTRTPSGIRAYMRKKLAAKGKPPTVQDKKPIQADRHPKIADKEYYPEEELDTGVFYSRKKPKFPHP